MENDGARTGVAHFTHNAMRIVVGFLFWLHGLQKLFGILGRDEPVELMSWLGAAGVIESIGGALIILGLFTRPVGGPARWRSSWPARWRSPTSGSTCRGICGPS